MLVIKFKKIHPDAKLPAYALVKDAGMDIYSIEEKVIKHGKISEIHTGLQIEIPPDMVGLVWDKSGLATKHGIKVMGGVWDEIYRGELIISLTNLLDEDYTISKGDKVAQLLVQKIEHPKIELAEKLSETARGSNRLGSTGKS